MRKSDILILLAMTLNIIMPFNMPKNNDIQPTAETINEVYIYEAVPVYVTETTESYFEIPEEKTPDIQPQEINEDFDILSPSGYDCEQLYILFRTNIAMKWLKMSPRSLKLKKSMALMLYI